MKHRKGQSTFELTLTIVVVIAAVIAMSIFMKRSVMGKFRETGDQVGGQFTPLSTTSDYTRTFVGGRAEKLGFGGQTDTTGITETQDRKGQENVNADLTDETIF